MKRWKFPFLVAVDIKINDFRSFHLQCLKVFSFSAFELARLKALLFIRNFVFGGNFLF